jgi:hypothetical protein
MGGILYDNGPSGLYVFLALTLVLGGAAATATGRAIAQTWRPIWHLAPYSLILSGGVQFLHYALFGEKLLSIQFYIVTVVIALVAACLGYFRMRALQMSTQYSWAFSQTGPLGWSEKSRA